LRVGGLSLGAIPGLEEWLSEAYGLLQNPAYRPASQFFRHSARFGIPERGPLPRNFLISQPKNLKHYV